VPVAPADAMSTEKPYCYAYPHPAVTTDVVLFTIRDEALQLLLIQRRNPPFQGCWALPGGFVDIDEDLDACAARELTEETGVRALYLEQLCTFGAVARDPRERVISVAYLARGCRSAPATTPRRPPGSRSSPCRRWPSTTSASSRRRTRG
jgi:ADP-ribose pyrophosphatase YjhB (NUDIX family)